ncbi:ATP-binding cassette domain-containing protein [Pseudobacter ginsenosidimutans]|uniref:Polar amino acid transport system ATP-binding protein n=1 Tax=Pseudobacter ginsenosidimutans TaxID=661488 RepID=A0A4Q7MU35_9BACT|nr:ATP-binding cassette domain-containing protein [Pseudobacter ginsenosidimutans]QEC41745.1 ABC transporter ATP-binding protein [Pseudobacter ginsenosidimutans]RZS71449.1 polar amino acid transport system ATP-binding protein [Pseudobacter ginsenosidimutans]
MTSFTYEQKQTILQVENLSVACNGKIIIQDINFTERDTVRPDRQQGQIIAFLGRSGRGKSTLFRALTGLESPTTGQVLIPDLAKEVTNGNQPAKKVTEGDVGFVDQKYTLFRHKTVFQSLLFAMRRSTLSLAEKKEKVLQHLSDWGLTQVKDQYPVFLSGGQRQRTAILEQLLSSGYYMVLDEPFSGLDVGNIESVKRAFQWVNASHELHTIIFSTHDIELAVELADSIYVLGYPKDEKGKLGTAGTLLKHFDLKSMGLAWQEDFGNHHLECVKMIRETMLAS